MISNSTFLRQLLLFAALIGSLNLQAAPPANFQNETVIASGLTNPTALEFLPDGRMLVSEFYGRVVVVQAGASVIDATPVLQLVNIINEDVLAGGERGLVNVLADPGFATNGYIYLFYTAGSPQRDRVSRFTMVGNTASLASEVVLWQGLVTSDSTDHHGGGLLFGPDGKLYISTGDNGEAIASQSLSSDRGKLLRINPDGSIPADNPFHDGAGSNVDAIWSLGHRNPYRISLDVPTGRIYIGDVGWNTLESVDISVRGANYGWPYTEGPSDLVGMTNPVFTYPHNGRDACVTGGFVYRGSQFPASYQGVYFYGDYAQKWIRYLTLDAAGLPTGSVNFEPANGALDNPSVGEPVMFKLGHDGSLYYVDMGWSPLENPATIRRIRYVAGNQPPVAVVSSNLVTPPYTVAFSSAGSSDPEGQPLTFLWTFGDDTTSTAANPTHTYAQAGMYVARLSVSDGVNVTQSATLSISVGNGPTGIIAVPVTGQFFMAGDTVLFSGSASDPEDGVLPASAFNWSVLFNHDSHVHPTIISLPGVTSGSFNIPNSGHDFDDGTNYEIVLTVTDSNGLQHRSSVIVYPDLVSQTFSTSPAGLTLTLDGVNVATPFTRDVLIGFQLNIGAPDQISGSNQYNFSSWSDGGAQSHVILAPEISSAYTATFNVVPLPVPANQVAAFAFNEGSGTAVADSSGSGHPGTLVNGPTWSAGKYGTGLTFDGANDYVSVANPATLNFGTNDFTVAAWIKRGATGSEHTIFSKTAAASWTTGGKELFISGSDNTLGFGAYGNGNEIHSTSTLINDGLWHHVAVTFVDSSNAVVLYIDGVARGSGTLALPADGSGHEIKFGGHPSGHTFNGGLDEFRIFSRALSLAEIQTVMNNAITPPPADITAPVLSNGLPTGTLAAGTTQTTLAVTTNENATSRFSMVAGTAYAAMTGTFTTTGGTAHSTTVAGLTNGSTYTYFVRSIDAAGNPSTSDFPITFSVANPPADLTPPVLSNGLPSGTLAVGTTQTALSLTTNENATVRYSTVAGTAYAAMTDTFTTTGATSHSTLVTGLTNGGTYTFYVRGSDAAGNPTTSDFPVTFSVASPPPPDTTFPTVSVTAPASGATVSGTTTVSANAADNVGVVGVQFLLDGANLGAEDTAAPYSIAWDTTAATIGAHSLTSRARDAAGNQTTSIPVPVTVAVVTAPANQIAALSFSEGSGTTAADNSGSGHTGTLVNGPLWSAGKYGTGLTLDGTNDYVSVANPTTFNFGTANFTITAWIKRGATGAEHTIFSKSANTSWTTGGKEFYVNASNSRLGFGRFGGADVFSTGAITNDGLWHHVAVTFVDSSNTLAFYIDGVASGGGTSNLPADGSTHVVKFGSHPAGHTFNGGLDEIQVFSRALSLAEIQTVMNNAITPPPADTTAPVLSNGLPTGTLAAGTTQTTLAVTTNENATSRYSLVAGTAYAAMTGTFTTTGGTAHSTTVAGLTNGSTYTYFVRSIDAAGNPSTSDFPITFSVANPPADLTPPVLSNGLPSGTLAVGTTQTALSLTTNENATVRYSTVPGTAYAAMSGTFTTTGATSHSTLVTGLTNGGTYTFYVRGSDAAGNPTTSDFPITFSVASPPPPDTTFPTVSVTAPASGATVSGTTTVSANAADNVGVVGVQFLLDGANLGAEDTAAPYSIAWDTTAATIGAHSLTARARDAAGNQTTSVAVPVTVTIVTAPANQITALSFSEGSGTTAADNSGSGHTGTLVNGPLWSVGKYGTGLTLDGTNDYVSVANPTTLNFGTSNFTIAVWIKRGATGSEHTIFSKTANTSWATGGKEFFISGSDSTLAFGAFGSAGEIHSSATIVNDGLWHHVAVTFVDSTNTLTLYLDGAAVANGTLNLPADDNSHVIKFGGHPAGHTSKGGFDEIRIFSRALSAGEIVTVMNNAISP